MKTAASGSRPHGNLIVLGSQWGDEGKAKIIDILASHFDIVGRYQGGGNAGHTVVVDGQKIIFHLVPTGILHPRSHVVLGNGMVIHPPTLAEELDMIAARGIPIDDRILISGRAHIIMPYHLLIEKCVEELRGSIKIGTTLRGIGPAYEDKVGRLGILAADLVDDDRLRDRLEVILSLKNRLLENNYNCPAMSAEEIIENYRPAIERMRPFIRDTSHWLNQALDNGLKLLCEGAQGTHLDIDHGTYPYVTSSNSSAGGALTGLGVGPSRFHDVLGVVKAYVTRVGAGPFPSEDNSPAGEQLRKNGAEFGSTTGRPRRCGWFDVPAMRYAAGINGLTALAMTKLDVLGGFDRLKICHAYLLQGHETRVFPEDPAKIAQCRPLFIEMDGWQEDISTAQHWDDLPSAARAYVKKLSELTGLEIPIVSIGPERERYVTINNDGFFTRFPALIRR